MNSANDFDLPPSYINNQKPFCSLTASNGSINWVHDATHQFTGDSVRQSIVVLNFEAMMAFESVSPPCAGIASAVPLSSAQSLEAIRTGW